MRPNIDLADALADAARVIGSPHSLEETLDAIVHTAKASLVDIDLVGISLSHNGGSIETVAGTDPLVWELDRLQYELCEGPCNYAVRAEEPLVVMENARHDQRWPHYTPAAVKLGLRSQVGLQLYVEDTTLGGLNLYSLTSDELDPDTIHTAELFATHAALALGKAREVEGLNAALETRTVIGKAMGILMQRYDLTEERAFAFLARASQTGNIKLRDVAREVCDEVERRVARNH